ncbi:MAG: hypothetical protein OEV78_03325 [Spirochaetia bacterium]|nr:hypothetical protein [Spirochaetia bacterium]
MENVIPQKGYKLTLSINTKNQHPESIRVKTFAPLNNSKQTISKEQGISDSYSFSLSNDGPNRRIIWQSNKISGNNRMEYVAYINSHHMKYVFNEKTVLNEYIPDNIKVYLKDSEAAKESKKIQVNSQAIKKKLDEITKNANTLYEKIQAIHKFITKDIRYINFSGELDAESCLLLMEGSCNGKSRLYVAMAQNLGLPARLVGGIILNKSPKKITHQWVEIYINGQWVPFCPTNDYFAELPKNYIALYYGDQVLFKRTSGINFDYIYSFETVNLPRVDAGETFKDLPINIYGLLNQFEKFNLSLDIFVYLLMLPFAALISVILKNIIGLETFGTFLPILIASVLSNTGVITGILVFFGIISIVYLINTFISRLDLLYHPRMAILLSFVILSLLITFSIGLKFNIYSLVYVVFFPVAIVAITINRVTILMEESSFKKLAMVTLNTIIVIIVSFYFIHSTFLQMIMLSFPELILALIGINIMVGRWAGFRLFEYLRFADLIKGIPGNVQNNY